MHSDRPQFRSRSFTSPRRHRASSSYWRMSDGERHPVRVRKMGAAR